MKGHIVAALCWLVPAIAQAQDFPTRPVTLVVPFSAGGVTDQVARLVASKVADSVGQPLVTENRPGAGGQVAASVVKQSPPDGYTLLVGDVATHAINASLYSKLPYDPVKDFVPVTRMVEMAHVLVVPMESPFKTINDLIAGARAKAGSVTYASVGVGSGAHLLGEILKSEHGLDIVHVPYRGSSQIVPDLLANRVGFFFGAVGSMSPLIAQGKLRALLVTDRQRADLLPNVPSAVEAGMPDLDLRLWFGILAPGGTAGAVVKRLNGEFVKALRRADVSQRLREMGAKIVAGSPEEFSEAMTADTARLGAVVRKSGARLD